MKYLVLLFVLIVAIAVWRSRERGEAASQTNDLSRRAPKGGTQDMVACTHCGTHVPQSEALMLGEQPYCCAEHRRHGAA